MHPPLCGEELEVQTRMAPPRDVPIPQTAQARPLGLRCIRCCVGTRWKVILEPPPPPRPGASGCPKRPRKDRRDSGVSAAVWGGFGDPNAHGSPTGRPYPPNGLGRTGGTRVYPPLRGEELEALSYIPHQGASLSPKRPRQDGRDSGVFAAVSGGVARSIIPDHPTGRPYPPNGPGKVGGTRVYSPLCEEVLKVQTRMAPPRGVPIPQTVRVGPEGLGCIRRCVGRRRKVNHTRPPHGASLSPKRPKQDRRDSGVSAAVWGGLLRCRP